ncbi:MltG/YceG/YrrL family protein [Facklamia hominis]|uniref:YceG-like family protein n=1 Tax=Facklamia hominis CCUG 36813 TaxID=883111 RepID=K1M248_9LACT|nr:endolytic transglycosylase MltG [Facklamia hominis]EKB56448.1 hypothetical protein HMPREF9706_00431 [Facklamia hominis CCUG 36813]PKY92583.1 hypothetical protein CYJ56_07305 [Facklamia hominis]RYC98957.1 hypothetical protein EKN08_00560 [Facklamia hominis]
MSKQSLRSLGVGFLLAAILTGAFAIFYQGQVPISGITLPSVLKGQNSKANESVVEELSQVKEEKDQLNLNIASINLENTGLTEKVNNQAESLEYYKSLLESNGILLPKDDSETAEDESESTVKGDQIFTVNQGESAGEIAQRLESEGFISSAAEFEQLISDWNLSGLIQAGDHELSTSMTIHEIASQLTNGAYYHQ